MLHHSTHSHPFPITWFLVADGKTAQTYTYSQVEKRIPCSGNSKHSHYAESREQVLVPVAGMKLEATSAAEYETGNDRLERVFESHGTAHHMAEPHIDLHEEIRQHFLETIASKLTAAKSEKSFDRLVLIAPGEILGGIKKHLTDDVLKSVVAELPKDYTKCDEETLLQHLQQLR
ncbi:MAG TPA: host attachment protein [Rickettsiales bacterium]|nr:host attachment protein [Rickettsiales bacterium]